MPKDLKKKLCLFVTDILNTTTFNGYYDMPNVSCFMDDINIDYLVLFTDKKEYVNNNCVCFYQYDECFKELIRGIFEAKWFGNTKILEECANVFKDIDILISVDITLSGDLPFVENLERIYLARLLSLYFINVLGKVVIPNISFVDKKTKEACFMGIDKGSVVAVSTKGLLGNPIKQSLLEEMVDETIERIEPKAIVLYNVIPNNKFVEYLINKIRSKNIKVILPDNKLLRLNKNRVMKNGKK